MNQKELNELRRRWKPDKNAISRIYGCFVNSNKEIITDLDESLGMVTQEEAEKYLSLLKKALSGALGKNLIDIVFSTQQVMAGEEHRMLMELRTSGAKDARVRQAFYQKVIQSLDMGESNYLLLLASDNYDVPLSLIHISRVSTREQHLDRQLKALMDAGVEERDIITDKVSGKDLEREGYQSLKNHFLRDGDTLIVKSLCPSRFRGQ